MTDDLIGKILQKKYRIVRLLGEGGMGSVYVAEHTLLNRTVAVKVMHSNASGPESVDRFFREAQAASAIGHPNIIEIFDVGTEDDGTVFMVMELLKGENLRSMLERRGALTWQRTVSIVLQILSALHAAHQKGIVHRDLKADNVFIAVDARMREEVKLLDFGIVKVLGEDFKNLNLTKSGAVMGTPQYLSPEQAMGGKDIDHRIDIWTVGLLIFEMLSGRLPFEGENYNEVLSKVLLESPPSLAELAPDTPKALVEIVEKALAKDRDERFVTVGEMIGDLLPLRDRMVDSLTPPASKALLKSIPPKTLASEKGETKKDDTKKERQPALMHTPNESVESLSPDLVETMGAELQSPIYRRNLTLLAFMGVFAVAILTAWLMITNEDRAQKIGPPPAQQVAPLTKVTSANTVKEPSSSPQKKSASADQEEEENNKKTKDEPAKPSEVTIEITGIPPGGWVTLDRKRVAPPITLPFSEEPVILKVAARGYHMFERALVPNKDHEIKVEMGKIEKMRKAEPSKNKSKILNPYLK